jgi:hypothetical protein
MEGLSVSVPATWLLVAFAWMVLVVSSYMVTKYAWIHYWYYHHYNTWRYSQDGGTRVNVIGWTNADLLQCGTLCFFLSPFCLVISGIKVIWDNEKITKARINWLNKKSKW